MGAIFGLWTQHWTIECTGTAPCSGQDGIRAGLIFMILSMIIIFFNHLFSCMCVKGYPTVIMLGVASLFLLIGAALYSRFRDVHSGWIITFVWLAFFFLLISFFLMICCGDNTCCEEETTCEMEETCDDACVEGACEEICEEPVTCKPRKSKKQCTEMYEIQMGV